MTIDMTQFYQVFFDECEEHLGTMEHLLLGLDLDPSKDDLNAIFRAAHSIKGSSSRFGFTDMSGVTHELETLLDRLRKRELAVTSTMIDAFLEARDVLKEQLNAHRANGESPLEPAQGVIHRLQNFFKDAAAAALPAGALVAVIESEGISVTEGTSGSYGFFDAPPARSVDASPAWADAEADASAIDDANSGYGFFDPIAAPQPSLFLPEKKIEAVE